MSSSETTAGGCLALLVAGVALGMLGALVVKWGWDAVAVAHFGAPPLDFWECFLGLNAVRVLLAGWSVGKDKS